MIAEVDAGRTLRRALINSLSFSGRSSRTEITVCLMAAVLFIPLATLASMLAGIPAGSRPALTFNLLVAIPFPALLVRRLHDIGLRGWWVLPAVGVYGLWLLRSVVAALQGIEVRIALDQLIWPLDWAAIAVNLSTIVLVCLPGTRGTNRFGPDPCA